MPLRCTDSTPEQAGMLIGVGALLVREGKKDLTALIEAWRALGMIRVVDGPLDGGAE